MFKIELFLIEKIAQEKKLLREYFFDKKLSISVGRHTRHDIQLDYLGVSSDHAKIHFFPVLLLEDMGSKNGTLLNGERINGTASFKHRDVIGITRYALRFIDEKMARLEAVEAYAEDEMPATWLVDAPAEAKPESGDETRIDKNAAMTPREFECLYWLSRGKTTAEIAPLLKISERTVNFHITNICAKLGAANRAQAIALAISLKLIDL